MGTRSNEAFIRTRTHDLLVRQALGTPRGFTAGWRQLWLFGGNGPNPQAGAFSRLGLDGDMAVWLGYIQHQRKVREGGGFER